MKQQKKNIGRGMNISMVSPSFYHSQHILLSVPFNKIIFMAFCVCAICSCLCHSVYWLKNTFWARFDPDNVICLVLRHMNEKVANGEMTSEKYGIDK